jgi:hypothetical protein
MKSDCYKENLNLNPTKPYKNATPYQISVSHGKFGKQKSETETLICERTCKVGLHSSEHPKFGGLLIAIVKDTFPFHCLLVQ